MFNATVIEVFIASPSDVIKERQIVNEIIDEWNIANSNLYNLILKSLRWEKNVYANLAQGPQNEINDQILEKADLLIAIFWTRLGSPTETYESGTVEEITKHIELGKPAMVYFSNAEIKPERINNDQYSNLKTFKEIIKKQGIFFEYDNYRDFENLIRNQLSLVINQNPYFKNISNFYKESKNLLPNLSDENEDLLLFLDNLPNFRKNNDAIDNFIEALGDYRFKKLLPSLNKLEILNARQGSHGILSLSIFNSFHSYTDKDIENIKNDILKGKFK
ncbi:hypothetical protein [Leptospira idonii]|uniref:DUF4062 domain-containing protein n=1 Tax=Leptospira idonii TaxID=1193500 RepID=A0A4V3JY65_9LEPT|nr:hypothetical protein [Leptospira idonii]TGN20046.1 hypothetical protein EHS15_04940 [Leptospira idonii]